MLLITIFISLILNGCATGSAIVTGTARPAIPPSTVRLYLEAPSNYETIGLVEASCTVEFSTQDAQDKTIEELKNQAAKIGANAVILTHSGDQRGDTYGYFSRNTYRSSTEKVIIAKGRAIYIGNK